MNRFDLSVVHFLNQFSQRSGFFDHAVCHISGDPLLKGAVVMAFLWWAWFRLGEKQPEKREVLLAGTFSAIPVIAAARLLALKLPYRERPAFSPSAHFLSPIGSDYTQLIHWSSFPSDHAALYFCLATTVFLVSRRAGLWALLYTAVVICLPRIYVGDHYPTDLIAGALIGVAGAVLFARTRLRTLVANPLLRWKARAPAGFCAMCYMGSFLIATNFETLRIAAVQLASFLRARMHG